MAALVQKQVKPQGSTGAVVGQQAENKDATVQPDKEEKDDANTAGTIDIYV